MLQFIYVDEGMDTGPIIAQACSRSCDGDREETEERIHAVEHELYTKTLKQLFENK